MESIFVNLKGAILGVLGKFMPEWTMPIHSIMISITAIAVLGPAIMMYLTLMERKVVGRMQNRIGPNRVGKWGLLQPLADGVKMLTKEDIVPKGADPVLHLLAPILIVAPALLLFAVLPFGKGMIAVDLNVGILYFLAVSSTTTIAIFMASWGSRNKYSILGGMRAVAQMISYEVPMVLSVVPVLLVVGSLSTRQIVEAQASGWFVLTPWGFFGAVFFFLCTVAECNRSPFDLPEAESEIVAGFHTEYSGMKFALFYMAEFMNCFSGAALTTTLYFGGWQGPGFLPSWIWFFLKTYSFIFVMMWFRGTLPRLRVDQLMGLAWKFLLPLTLVNILAAGLWYYLGGILKFFIPLVLMAGSFTILTWLNKPYVPEKREYQFAD
ncbi:MAG TPA: NADH-quinone oxidoreductase subunit NuoH [Verrucomicrobiae bacterium]|jgi:NADH-quinone oxidoreductase subunit H|nr:NADH-quinone oxidoreductase subunit NuoH [Verrucomicrobiae bacterium]